MINNMLLPKAYREVFEIIKYIPKNEYEKIPVDYIENMQRYMDKDYNYEVTNFNNFEKQEMLYETEVILAILYREYWATKHQKEVILANESAFINKQEEEKKKKYNPNNMFTDKMKNSNYCDEMITDETALIEPKNEKWYKKIIAFLRNLFNK